MKHFKHIAGVRIHRLEALSDGVFAIVVTLLVLDIKVPVIEAIHSEIQLVHAFFQLTPKLLTYFMSFITLGIFWTGHTTQFHFIKKVIDILFGLIFSFCFLFLSFYLRQLF
jgi:uncharacterized membrane protein